MSYIIKAVSFSAGGFNTHSMLAGMTAGLIDALADRGRIRDLGLAVDNVDTFSSNSGGAWFMSQLA